MKSDDIRFARLRDQVESAVSFRDATLMRQMTLGETPFEISMCLGEGRCLIKPINGERPTCPFCSPLNLDNRSHSRVDDIIKRVVSGH